MTTILQPTLSRLKIQKNIVDLKKSIRLSESIFFGIWAPFLIGGVFYIDKILKIFNNEILFSNNMLVFIGLAVAALFNGLIIIKGNIYFAFTQTKKMLWPIFFASFLNVILNISLIFIYKSIFFAALSSLISYFFAFCIFQYQIMKNHSIGMKIDNIIEIIFSSILMVVIAFILDNIWPDYSIILLLFKIFFSALSYLISMYLIRGRIKWNI
jgi:peptidoglycan biosynthesis protein MviN/MurJ (putative lipid II flippase)